MPIKNFFSKKGSLSLLSGVTSLLVGVSVLVVPAYANNEVPSELPEVVGDQIPSLDDKVKEDRQEKPKNKKGHEKERKKDREHRKDLEKPLPQQPENPSPVSELPEQPSPIVDTDKGKTEPEDQIQPREEEPKTTDPNPPISELPEQPSQVVDTDKGKAEPEDRESPSNKEDKPLIIQPREEEQKFDMNPPISELPEQPFVDTTKVKIKPEPALLNKDQTVQIAKNTNTASTFQGEAPVVRTETGTLPKTATNAPNGVVAGGFILLGGALIHRYYRVRDEA